jgi:hypothetical protein
LIITSVPHFFESECLDTRKTSGARLRKTIDILAFIFLSTRNVDRRFTHLVLIQDSRTAHDSRNLGVQTISQSVYLPLSLQWMGFVLIHAYGQDLTLVRYRCRQLAGADFGQPKAIFEYLWESTPGTWTHAGVIPAPAAIAMLAGLPLLPLGRRRRST